MSGWAIVAGILTLLLLSVGFLAYRNIQRLENTLLQITSEAAIYRGEIRYQTAATAYWRSKFEIAFKALDSVQTLRTGQMANIGHRMLAAARIGINDSNVVKWPRRQDYVE